jgi:hypothetical protein
MKRTDITELFPEATAEQIDKIMDLNGADINKAKGELEAVKAQLIAAQAEIGKNKPDALDEVTARANALQTELDSMKRAEELRVMRAKVSKDTNVPAELLTGETEDACAEQAKAILAFATPSGYPSLRDGGELHTMPNNKTRDKFAEWAKDNL